MYLWLPIILFTVLVFPYLNVIPANDGQLEFLFAQQWLQNDNIFHLLSLHPPFKHMLLSAYFTLFGYQYAGILGLLIGIAGIVSLYIVAKKLFNEKVALLSSTLLAMSGLYISVSVFTIHDFIITVTILAAYACYLHKRYVFYVLLASISVLTKETAIFFPLSILIYEIFYLKRYRIEMFIPVIVLGWYIGFVHLSGYHTWNEWNFSSTAQKGSIYTMLHNAFTLSIFNKYAVENWLHLFVFNFNWVYWIFAYIGFRHLKSIKQRAELIPIAWFFGMFALLVLTFQTYTINRYVLPLLPFIYLFASYGIYKLPYKAASIAFLIIISFISLTRSIDPLSNIIWHKTQLLGEKVYINTELDGYDGVTYNLQYLSLMQERTNQLQNGECYIPVQINYDNKILKLFKIPRCITQQE